MSTARHRLFEATCREHDWLYHFSPDKRICRDCPTVQPLTEQEATAARASLVAWAAGIRITLDIPDAPARTRSECDAVDASPVLAGSTCGGQPLPPKASPAGRHT